MGWGDLESFLGEEKAVAVFDADLEGEAKCRWQVGGSGERLSLCACWRNGREPGGRWAKQRLSG